MYYEINVAKAETLPNGKLKPNWDNSSYDYRHFFATTPRSITNREDLKKVLPELMKAFPSPEYQITVRKWVQQGEGVDTEEILKEIKNCK